MGEGGEGLNRIRFSSGDWIIGAGETGSVLYLGCGSGVCGRTVAPPPPILAHKNTPPPVHTPPPPSLNVMAEKTGAKPGRVTTHC